MTETMTLSSMTLELPKEPPTRVLLLRHGENNPRDSRPPMYLEDAAAVIARHKARAQSTPLVIDYDHQSHAAKHNGKPSPAAGWITSLSADAEGLFADVEWTEAASAAIAAREYRFISPTVLMTKKGVVKGIQDAALTNKPALELKALASEQTPNEADGDTSELRLAICSRLGIDPDHDDETLMDALFAPAAALDEARAELRSMRAQEREDVIARMVDGGVEDGKISPAMREAAHALCSIAPQRFADFLDAMPPLLGEPVQFNGAPPRGNGSLSDNQLAVCSALGLSADEYAAQMRAE